MEEHTRKISREGREDIKRYSTDQMHIEANKKDSNSMYTNIRNLLGDLRLQKVRNGHGRYGYV